MATATDDLVRYTCLLAGLIPDARGKDLPRLGTRGFLFQHYAEFAAAVDAFLTGAS
jgi:hypothetical protein